MILGQYGLRHSARLCGGLLCRILCRATSIGRLFEMVIRDLQVVLLGYRPRIADPGADYMDRPAFGQLCFPRTPQVLK